MIEETNNLVEDIFKKMLSIDQCLRARQMQYPDECSFTKIGNMEVCHRHSSFKIRKI